MRHHDRYTKAQSSNTPGVNSEMQGWIADCMVFLYLAMSPHIYWFVAALQLHCEISSETWMWCQITRRCPDQYLDFSSICHVYDTRSLVSQCAAYLHHPSCILQFACNLQSMLAVLVSKHSHRPQVSEMPKGASACMVYWTDSNICLRNIAVPCRYT